MLALNAYWVGLSFMWNALHPIVLPAILLDLVPDARKNTYLGLLTFAGLIVAMGVQPIAGALSDRWASRLGRRRPLMLIGTALDVVFLAILGRAGGLGWLYVGYIGLQLSSNAAQAPMQALLRDRVAPEQLGTASSLKTLLDILSLAAASLVAARLMKVGPLGFHRVFFVIAGLLIVTALITAISTKESPAGGARQSAHRSPISVRDPEIRGASQYWLLIAERALFLLGVYGLQAFGQYYIRDVLGIANAAAQTGNLLAVVTAGVILLALAGGWLTDRFGARRILYAASLVAALGLLLMIPVRDSTGLMLAGSIVGAGIGLFLTANWALANQLAPKARAGEFLGLANVATAGSAALARLQGPVVDYLNALRPAEWLGYRGIFVFGAACVVISALFLRRMRGYSGRNLLPAGS